jgi:hypothetical protein
MKRKHLMITLIAGLTTCGLSSAATEKIGATTRNAGSGAKIPASPVKIDSATGIARFLPEVYVGNGTRPPDRINAEEGDSSDVAMEDLSKEEPET